MTLAVPGFLSRHARSRPDALAVVHGGLSLTYAALDRVVGQTAAAMRQAGVGRGDRVGLLASPSAGWVIAAHAAMRCGAVIVPLNTRLTLSELQGLLASVALTGLMHDDAHADLAHGLEGDFQRLTIGNMGMSPADGSAFPDPAMLDLSVTSSMFFTSGTSGTQKVVVHPLGSWWHGAMASALHLGHQAEDVWSLPLPLFHVGGFAIMMRAAIAGLPLVVQSRFDPAEFSRTCADNRVTLTSFVPTMLRDLLATGEQVPPHLRVALLGGASAPQELVEDAGERGWPVAPTYGMTETASQIATLPPPELSARIGSSGRALPHLAVAVRATGEEVPVGEGEVLVRGLSLMAGYLGQPPLDRDAWFATGDHGIIDEEGYLTVVDRRSDLIVSGGENIYPAEVERAVEGIPGIAAAAVVGVPDERWGSAPVAFVVAERGVVAADIDVVTHLRGRVAPYKIPKRVIWVNELPMSASGKVLRRQLRDLAAEGSAGKGRRPG